MNDLVTPGRARPGRRPLLLGLVALLPASRLAAAASSPPGRIRLAWQPGLASNIAVLVARKNGLFAVNGCDVDLVAVDGSATLADLLRADEADACIGAALSLLPALRGGLDAKLTAGISGGGLRLMAERRSKLRHIEDLHGKTIGVARLDGSAKLFFSIMMRRKGLDPFRDVTWVELATAAQAEALGRGAVDAVALPDPEAFMLREELKLVEIASDISGSYRDRTAQVLACSGRLLAHDPAACRGLTHALLQAATTVTHDPATAGDLGASFAPQLSEVDRIRMLRTEAPDQHPTGAALVEDIAAYADELRLLGLFPYELNAGKFARSVCQRVT